MFEAMQPIENLLNKIIDRFFEETRSWELNELKNGNKSFELKSKTIYATYNQLPFQYQSAYYFLDQIWQHLSRLEAEYQGPEGVWVEIEDKDMRPISFFVEGFFRSLRSAQDSVMLFLNRIYKCGLPGSISDFNKKINKNRNAYKLPEKITNIIIDYWASSGAKLRDYRDFATHSGLLVLDGHMCKISGQFHVSILLPNNPEQKSEKKAKFKDPTIHIQETISSFFLEFTAVLLRLFCEHVDPGKLAAITSLQRGMPTEGMAILPITEFNKEISALHDSIAGPIYKKNIFLKIFKENGTEIASQSGKTLKYD